MMHSQQNVKHWSVSVNRKTHLNWECIMEDRIKNINNEQLNDQQQLKRTGESKVWIAEVEQLEYNCCYMHVIITVLPITEILVLKTACQNHHHNQSEVHHPPSCLNI